MKRIPIGGRYVAESRHELEEAAADDSNAVAQEPGSVHVASAQLVEFLSLASLRSLGRFCRAHGWLVCEVAGVKSA